MEFVEGNCFSTVVHRKNQKEFPMYDEFGGNGVFAEHCDMEDCMCEVRVSSGRTIPIGPFEFARVSVGLNLFIKDEEQKKAAFDAAQMVVLEILERETSSLSKKSDEAPREPVPIVFDFPCVRRVLSVEYGLTLKHPSKQYEFNKMDFGLTVPVSDGADLEIHAMQMQTWLEERCVAEKLRLVKDAEDKGKLGF